MVFPWRSQQFARGGRAMGSSCAPRPVRAVPAQILDKNTTAIWKTNQKPFRIYGKKGNCSLKSSCVMWSFFPSWKMPGDIFTRYLWKPEQQTIGKTLRKKTQTDREQQILFTNSYSCECMHEMFSLISECAPAWEIKTQAETRIPLWQNWTPYVKRKPNLLHGKRTI